PKPSCIARCLWIWFRALNVKTKSSVPPMMITPLPARSAALNSCSLTAWFCNALDVAEADDSSSNMRTAHENTDGSFMINTY
ncbi:hypothetical protein R9Y17_002713, partial [Citrobacter freundii]